MLTEFRGSAELLSEEPSLSFCISLSVDILLQNFITLLFKITHHKFNYFLKFCINWKHTFYTWHICGLKFVWRELLGLHTSPHLVTHLNAAGWAFYPYYKFCSHLCFPNSFLFKFQRSSSIVKNHHEIVKCASACSGTANRCSSLIPFLKDSNLSSNAS